MSQAEQLKSRNPSQLEGVNNIKVAIEGMLLILATAGTDNQRMRRLSFPLPLKKRPFTHPENPPSKRQRFTSTDDVLDQAADEVNEVVEWELILANWNTEQEDLPFSLLDSTLVISRY